MASNDSRTSHQGAPQFTVATLLMLIVLCAGGLSLLFVMPPFISMPATICLAIAVPAFLTIGVIYGKGDKRTFCIGALFPAGVLLYIVGWFLAYAMSAGPILPEFDSLEAFFDELANPFKVYAGASWLLSLLIGVLAMFLKRNLIANRD